MSVKNEKQYSDFFAKIRTDFKHYIFFCKNRYSGLDARVGNGYIAFYPLSPELKNFLQVPQSSIGYGVRNNQDFRLLKDCSIPRGW